MPQSPDIRKNPDRGIPVFWSFLYGINFHNSRTSDDIDIKNGPVAKIDKENKITSEKFSDGLILENFDITVIYPFEVIQKLDSRYTVCKLNIFIDSNNWNTIALSKGTILAQKAGGFCKKCWLQQN